MRLFHWMWLQNNCFYMKTVFVSLPLKPSNRHLLSRVSLRNKKEHYIFLMIAFLYCEQHLWYWLAKTQTEKSTLNCSFPQIIVLVTCGYIISRPLACQSNFCTGTAGVDLADDIHNKILCSNWRITSVFSVELSGEDV